MTVAVARSTSASRGPGGLPAGSLGMFSLSIDESPLAQKEQQPALGAQLELLETAVAPLLTPRGPFSSRLQRDVLLFRDVLVVEDGEVDGVVLASKLTAAGYRVAVRQALGGGSGMQVFSNLRHSFLLVTAPPECTCAGNDFIVEPHFREQFEISHPTPRYSGLLALLPAVLVASAEQITALVQLLCAEMSLAFEHHGLSLPPWRQSKSLLSKWLPSKARDYDLSPYASPRANSPEPLFPLAAISAASAAAAAAVAAAQQQAPYEAALQPISEAPSGSVTPAAFSGDDASPRAVLCGASDMLFSQQAAAAQAAECGAGTALGPANSAQHQAGGSGTAPPALVRKSLLSSSLAATGRRAASPEQQRRSAGSGDEPGRAARAVSEPLPPLLPASPAAAMHRGGPGGLSYRIATEWQQPAIRTVKMQGSAARQQPK
ncbi:hypothetical protein ABPG75_006273 [Micractinium tetrahymenae]